jgi:hypothetical protein
LSAHWPTPMFWIPTTRTPLPSAATLRGPTRMKGGLVRLSLCWRAPWPTGSASWAPTTRTRRSPGATSRLRTNWRSKPPAAVAEGGRTGDWAAAVGRPVTAGRGRERTGCDFCSPRCELSAQLDKAAAMRRSGTSETSSQAKWPLLTAPESVSPLPCCSQNRTPFIPLVVGGRVSQTICPYRWRICRDRRPFGQVRRSTRAPSRDLRHRQGNGGAQDRWEQTMSADSPAITLTLSGARSPR